VRTYLISLLVPGVFLLPAAHAENVTSTPEPESAEATPYLVVTDMDTVVVTASRMGESPFSSPHQVGQLSSTDFRNNASRTIPEALGELPGVVVQKTAHGHGSPYIRGFTAFRNLLLIDGIRFNNSIFREGPNQYWNTIDPYSTSRMELVYGPGSTLYGSDAIGATLNLFTKDSGFLDGEEGKFYQEGSAHYRFDTASLSHVGRLDQSLGIGQQVGLHVGATIKEYGDVYSADIGTQENTGYGEWAFDLRLDAQPYKHTLLTLVHQQVEQDDIWRTHQTIYAKSWAGTSVGNELSRILDQRRSLSYIRLGTEDIGSWIDAYEITVSYQNTEERRDRVRSNLRRDVQGFDVHTLGVGLQLESDWPLGRLIYGVDYYRDWVDSFRTDFNADGSLRARRIQGPVGDNATYDLFGAFIQNRLEYGDLTFILGGRYTHAAADIGRVEDPNTGNPFAIQEAWDAAVFNARALYEIISQWSVYSGVAQAFRAPNLSDLSRLDTARTNEIETASPGLDPEYTLTVEIGSHVETPQVDLDGAFFYTFLEDTITRTPTGNTIGQDIEVQKSNTGDGTIYGFELSGAWRPFEEYPEWSLFGHASWLEGRIDTFPTSDPVLVSEPISRLAPAMGQVGVRWEDPRGHFRAEGLVKLADRADRLSTRDRADTQRIPPGGTPGYVVASLRGAWQATDHLSLNLTLDNITNEDYRVHGSGQNEPGFGAIFDVIVSW
jgi:hemoglobin/transferrin/lactoferrin receptor protein